MTEGIRLISDKPKPKPVEKEKKQESTMTQKDVSMSKALSGKTGRNGPKDENQLDDKTSFALTLLLFITALLVLGAGYYHYCVKQEGPPRSANGQPIDNS